MSRGGTSHTDRVMMVQQALVEMGGGPQRLSDIAAHTGLDDSTVGRILARLAYTSIVVRPSRGLYALGPGAAEVGFHALTGVNFNRSAEVKAVLDKLREETDQGLVFLYTKSQFGANRQCLMMSVGDSDLVELGMTALAVLSVTRSLRTGASGRTILAYLSPEVQELVFEEEIPDEAGPGVLRDNGKLKASLAEIRDQGYALGYQECMKGWNSVAAPIIWDDIIVGAVLMLKPVHVMPHAPEQYIAATVEAAAQLSFSRTGWPNSN